MSDIKDMEVVGLAVYIFIIVTAALGLIIGTFALGMWMF